MSLKAPAGFSQTPSQYSIEYRLQHSPPPADLPAEASSSIRNHDPDVDMMKQPQNDRSMQNGMDPHTDMLKGRSISGSILSFSEIEDASVLRSSPTDSARFEAAVVRFVSRALTKQPTGDEGYAVAMQYFSDLAAHLEGNDRSAGNDVSKVHDLLIHKWQRHVTEVLGQSVKTPGRLVAVLDDIIGRAESLCGVAPPAITRLALHNALNNLGCDDPAIPQVQAANTDSPSQLLGERGNLKRRHDEIDRSTPLKAESIENDKCLGTQADPAKPDVVNPPTCQSTKSSPDGESQEPQAKKPRFRNLRHFFRHHVTKAKKNAALDGREREKDRRTAKEAAKAAWIRLDMGTQATWEDLFGQCREDDAKALDSATTAHLFRDGVAIQTWAASSSASPAAEPRKAHQDSQASTTDETDGNDSNESYNPVVKSHPWTNEHKSGHMTFLSLGFEVSTSELPKLSKRLANASQTVITQVRGNTVSVKYGYHHLDTKRTFVVRWHDINAARVLTGMMVKCGKIQAIAHAYPTSAPQMFVARMNHNHNTDGICLDDVFESIAAIAPDTPFHLRHDTIRFSANTTWLVVFQKAPRLLHFTLEFSTKSKGFATASFEPLMAKAPCPLCREGHSAVHCKLLQPASYEELEVDIDESHLLRDIPVAID